MRWLLIGAMLLLGGAAAACGGSDNGPSDAANDGDGTGDATDADDVPGDGTDAESDACVPGTCRGLRYECGEADLGCGVVDDCGSCAPGRGCEDNICISCGTFGCTSCEDATWATDCGTKACATATGCSGGWCTWEAVDCSTGSECPHRVCQATDLGGGAWQNDCVEIPNAECGDCSDGVCGMCVDSTCVTAPSGATFVSAPLNATASGRTVTGAMSYHLPAAGRLCIGTTCVTGNVVP